MKKSPLYIKSGMGRTSEGSPVKLWGAVVKGAQALHRGYKVLKGSKKAKNAARGTYAAIGGADYATKKNKPWYEKTGEVVYDWSGVGDIHDLMDWGTGQSKAKYYPWKGGDQRK